MTRIFLTLSILSNVLLATAFWLGSQIGDPFVRDLAVNQRISVHFLTGLAAVVFAILVHAIVVTYFMGTGRWLEETTQAYRLEADRFKESRGIKYRTILMITGCLLCLIVTGAFGAAADPASPVGFRGWWGLPAGTIHMLIAISTFGLNLIANVCEFLALQRNGELVQATLAEVRRIRFERGLEV